MRISDWSSDVCSSDLGAGRRVRAAQAATGRWRPRSRSDRRRRPSRRRCTRLPPFRTPRSGSPLPSFFLCPGSSPLPCAPPLPRPFFRFFLFFVFSHVSSPVPISLFVFLLLLSFFFFLF